MPVNPFFNQYNDTADQRLMDDLINETVQNYGIDAFYLPRTSLSKFDPLFGDDPTRAFKSAYPIEVYVQSVDEFEGGELFSKFGLEVKKQARFLVTNRTFKKNMPASYVRPREGDIIWMSNFKAFFEIKYVDEEHFFYTFGKTGIYGYSMISEKWNYAQENVDTGNLDIDETVNDRLVTSYAFQMGPVYGDTIESNEFNMDGTFLLEGGEFTSNSSNTINAGEFDHSEGFTEAGTYTIGEEVFQTDDETPTGNVTASGTVSSWNLPSGMLELSYIKAEFAVNKIINGRQSQARWTLNSNNVRDDAGNLLDNNEDIAEEASGIINFSETNPFGEPLRS